MNLSIKDFPDTLLAKAKAAAALQRKTLREFIIEAITKALEGENNVTRK